jgi:hypothetical protein
MSARPETRRPHRPPGRRFAAALAGALAALALLATAVSQSASGWDLTFHASFGGGTSDEGPYVLDGLIGQPFAGESEQGAFAVNAGLFGGGAEKYRAIAPLLTHD